MRLPLRGRGSLFVCNMFMDGTKSVEKGRKLRARRVSILCHPSTFESFFTLFEWRVATLRHKVSNYLLHDKVGKKFLHSYHPDIDARDQAINTGLPSSWGGPETLFATSQILGL